MFQRNPYENQPEIYHNRKKNEIALELRLQLFQLFFVEIEPKLQRFFEALELRLSMLQSLIRITGNQIRSELNLIEPAIEVISSYLLTPCLVAPITPNRLEFSSFESSSKPFSIPFSIEALIDAKIDSQSNWKNVIEKTIPAQHGSTIESAILEPY